MEVEKSEKSAGCIAVEESKVLDCDSCGDSGPSVVRPSFTVLGAVWIFSWLGWGCCCIAALPFWCSSFRKVLHRCPACGKVLEVEQPNLSTCAKAGLICLIIGCKFVSLLILAYMALKYVGIV